MEGDGNTLGKQGESRPRLRGHPLAVSDRLVNLLYQKVFRKEIHYQEIVEEVSSKL